MGPSVYLWDALLAAVATTLLPKVRGQMPGVQKWHDHRGDPARGESLVGHHWALIGLGSAWGAGSLCWPLLARWLPGQLNPLGCGAGAEGVQRLDFWAVVVALGRELPQYGGNRPLRVVADAYFSKASFLNPLMAVGITVISRLRKDAVGWDDPAPVVGKRPRGRPRQKGQAWKLATLLGVEAVTAVGVTIDGQEERLRVVWRDMWLRDVTCQVRVVVIATEHTPILLVSTDLALPPAVIIQLYAARFPMALSLRDLQQYCGLGDDQCDTLLAIHRCPSRRYGLLSVAADAAPGSTGSLAGGGVQALHQAADPAQFPATPPGAASASVAADFRRFRPWCGLPKNRGQR